MPWHHLPVLECRVPLVPSRSGMSNPGLGVGREPGQHPPLFGLSQVSIWAAPSV